MDALLPSCGVTNVLTEGLRPPIWLVFLPLLLPLLPPPLPPLPPAPLPPVPIPI